MTEKNNTSLMEDYDPARDDPDMRYTLNGDFTVPFLRPFRSMKDLLQIKSQNGFEVIIIIPTRNEEPNIGKTLDNVLPLKEVGLVDIIRVIDNSDDNTEAEVRKRNVPFDRSSDILTKRGITYEPGKGTNLYAGALHYKKPNQIIIFADADFSVRASQIQGVLSPLIEDTALKMSLAWLKRRTMRGEDGGSFSVGGRATANAFKPGMRIYYPELNGLQQPLCGLYAARADTLATCNFTNGFGIETLLITQIADTYGAEAFVQVFCGEKTQLGQNSHSIAMMSQQIVRTIIQSAEAAKRKPVEVTEVITYPMQIDRETGITVINKAIEKLPEVILDAPEKVTVA